MRWAQTSPASAPFFLTLECPLHVQEGGMEADLNTELLAAEALGYEPTLVPKAKPPAPRARVRCAHSISFVYEHRETPASLATLRAVSPLTTC
jgi:hypothetical protein